MTSTHPRASMIVRKKLAFILFWGPLILSLACLVACHPLDTSDAKLEDVTLQLSWFHQFQNAGYYAALEKGYYREAGLNVSIVPGGSFDTYAEVAAGRAQYGVANTDILLERMRGKPVVALATIFQHAPRAIMVRQDSGLNNPQALAGKRIWFAQTARSADISAMFLNEGIQPDQMNLVSEGRSPTHISNETIDGFSVYTTNEPYYWIEQDIPFVLIKPQTYGIDFYGDTIYTLEAEVENHPDRVRQFREASLRGWTYAMDHPEEIIDLIQARYDASKSREHLLYEAETMREYVLSELVEIGHMNPGRWQRIADTYVELGMAEPDYSLDGFIYDPNLSADLSDVYQALWFLGGLALVGGLVIGTLVIFNKQLQTTVEQRTRELQQSEARFRAMWETASDAIVLVDAEGFVIAANPAYAKLHNRPLKELVGHMFTRVYAPKDRTAAFDRYAKAFTDQSSRRTFESVFKEADGTHKTVESRIGFITDAEGHNTAMLAIIRDITQRRHTEDALRQLSQAVQQSPAAIVITDLKGRITYTNPAFTQVTGYTFKEIEGQYLSRLQSDQTPIERYKSLWDKVLAGETYRGELVNQKKSGEVYWDKVIISPVKDDQGKITHVLMIHEDITERKQFVRERARLEAHLRQDQRLETIGTLAGGIAHDLNNILTPIMGYTRLIQVQFDEDDISYKRLAQVLKASQRAKELVRQILTFSHQIEDDRVSTELPPLIQEAIALLRSSLPSTIEIRQEIDSDCDPILATPSQIHQIVMNLCTNAYQAMEQDGGILTIRLSQISQAELSSTLRLTLNGVAYACLEITDTGPGMPAVVLERIFEPFFTTKPQGKGTGLGLSVVHGIVKSHEGSIVTQSKPGEGTTFALYFPISTRPLEPEPYIPEPPQRSSIERVLVVDDESDIVDLMRQWLTESGYQVVGVTSSTEALAIYQAEHGQFDLVITDLTMPHMTGLQLVREMKKLRPDLPVILTTGYGDELSHATLHCNGISQVVMKPIMFSQLNHILNQVLNNTGNEIYPASVMLNGQGKGLAHH